MLASALQWKARHVQLGQWTMLCRETTLSDQGKLLIPRDLCEQVRLLAGSEVMRVGRHRYFEIWNRENRIDNLGIV